MQFMLIQLVIAAVIIIASVWFLKSIEKDRLVDNQTELSINLGKTIVAKLQQKTSRIENLAVTIGALAESYQENPQQLNNLVPAILNQSGQQEVILGGGVWPEPFIFNKIKQKNSYFWSRNYADELIKINDYNAENISAYFNESWYIPAKFYPTDTTYWSKSYVDPFTKNAMITASVPMWSQHEFIGVATVDVAVASLDDFFNTATSSQGGYVFALDQQNRLLSYPHTDIDGRPTVKLQELFQPFSIFADTHPELAPLQRQLEAIDKQFIEKTNSANVYEKEQLNDIIKNVPLHEQDKLVALINNNANNQLKKVEVILSMQLKHEPRLKEPVLVTVFLMPGTYWKIILVTPLSSITEGPQSIAGSVGIYLVSIQILALMLLFILQNKLFIAPISRMVAALNDSNPAKIELESSNRNDEIGMLAKAFSSRTRQLEIALSSLDATNLALEQQLDVQQQAQYELKQKTEQLHTVLNSAHNLIFITDLDGVLTLVNDQFCHAIKRERLAVIGAYVQQVMPKNIAIINSQKDLSVIENKMELSYEQSFPAANKQHVYLVTKFPIFNQQKQIHAVGTIAFDITSTKEQELKKTAQFEILRRETTDNIRFIERLEQTNKRLENESVAVKANHNRDKNFEKVKLENQALYPSLVATIVKPIFRKQDDLAAKAYRLSKGEIGTNDFTHSLAEQTERLRHLEYLFSAQDYVAKPIDLVALLQHIVALLQPKSAAKNIDLIIEGQSRLIVEGIHWQFLLIFYRAINNTLTDAFPQKAGKQQINIQLHKTNQMINITIVDNGKGFTDEQLSKQQLALNQNEVLGTLSALSVWLKSEFNGNVSISCAKDSAASTVINYELQIKI
ncbi:sensor histidine kinase [Shewanella sairae]|uniref:histidine kinase n=2 Tax=Shewanella sairae TaxID=190310 RepID=A0ABQ4PDT3_9GAMM|nr:sensor histidine kinase [Shewanella sairae]